MDIKRLVKALNDSDKIITPGLTKWLIQHGDDPLSNGVADRIHKLLTTRPRIRSNSFSSSAAGTCLRRQELAFLDVPVPGIIDPQLQNIFLDGKWRHLRWQATLLEAGLVTDVEYGLPWPRKRSMGSMDGVGIVSDTHPKSSWRGLEFGLELKGVSTFQYGRYVKSGPKQQHLDQVHRYFLSGGFDLFVIIYEDKTTQGWTEWVIEPDVNLLEAQKVELRNLNGAIDRKRLDPMLMSCQARMGPHWQECPYAGKMGPCEQAGDWPTVP